MKLLETCDTYKYILLNRKCQKNSWNTYSPCSQTHCPADHWVLICTEDLAVREHCVTGVGSGSFWREKTLGKKSNKFWCSVWHNWKGCSNTQGHGTKEIEHSLYISYICPLAQPVPQPKKSPFSSGQYVLVSIGVFITASKGTS